MNNGTTAFGLIFDNLLNLSVGELRHLVNLYALLYESLIISDSWCATNVPFQQMVTEGSGLELLRSRIIVPARRDVANTPVESFVQLMGQPKMTGMTFFQKDTTPAVAALLDRESTPLIFSISEVGAAYQALSTRVLERDFMLRFGMAPASADLVGQIFQEARAANTPTNTNTFVKDAIWPRLPLVDADLVMELARAPYSLNLPNYFQRGVVGPAGFRGDRIMALLQGIEYRSTAMLDVGVTADVTSALYTATADNPLVAWLLETVVSDMTPEELMAARSNSRRPTYMAALEMFLATPNQNNWDNLVATIIPYLEEAASAVFYLRDRKGQITADPSGSAIVLEGDSALRIVRGDEPVVLSALAGHSTTIQVVGRIVSLPQRIEK